MSCATQVPHFLAFSKTKRNIWPIFQKCRNRPASLPDSKGRGLRACQWVRARGLHLAPVPRASSTNPSPCISSCDWPGLCNHSCLLICSFLALLNGSGLTSVSPPQELTALSISSKDFLASNFHPIPYPWSTDFKTGTIDLPRTSD